VRIRRAPAANAACARLPMRRLASSRRSLQYLPLTSLLCGDVGGAGE
jgi:hypothetical protein